MKLILNVTCANDDADDAPNTFVADLSNKDVERLNTLAQTVTDVDAYQIEEFNYSGTWYSKLIEQDDIDETTSLDDMIAQMDNDQQRVDIPTVCVTSTHLQFCAVPKHCGSDMTLTTRNIELAELNKGMDIIKL